MKHKMIGCSEECLEFACCDFCIYAHHEFFFDNNNEIVCGGPIGCGLYQDERHQDIADGCGCCPDFHCFRANEGNMVVKEIDDGAKCTAPDTDCPHWQGVFCELDDANKEN